MLITKELEWDMGHRVPNHKSKCRNVHGHRYRVQIVMEGDVVDIEDISDQGMVIDFGDIKTIAKEFIDRVLDHGYMGHCVLDGTYLDLFKQDNLKIIPVLFIPTAENIAVWLFKKLSPLFEDKYKTGLLLRKIILWETPTSFVEYGLSQQIYDLTLEKTALVQRCQEYIDRGMLFVDAYKKAKEEEMTGEIKMQIRPVGNNNPIDAVVERDGFPHKPENI